MHIMVRIPTVKITDVFIIIYNPVFPRYLQRTVAASGSMLHVVKVLNEVPINTFHVNN